MTTTNSSSSDIATLVKQLPLQHVGTVSILGDCFCFGLGVEYTPDTYRPYPVYLNIAGAASSVEATWARLVQGKETVIIPTNRTQSNIYLHPPEKGMYVRLQRKLDGLGMDNLILLHRQLAAPTFHDADLAFLFVLDSAQACLKLVEYIRQTVKVAVFPAWGSYLRQEGPRHGLLTAHSTYEGAAFWTVRLDPARWTALISSGLAQGHLHFH